MSNYVIRVEIIIKYYHYFDYDKSKYYCTEEDKCHDKFNKLILEKNECVTDCSMDEEYIYGYKIRCYKQLPDLDNNGNIKYSEEYPFEKVKTQECVSKCKIYEFQNNFCIKIYLSNETNDKIEEKMVKIIQDELVNGFNTFDIDNGKDEIIEQENFKSKITISNSEISFFFLNYL